MSWDEKLFRWGLNQARAIARRPVRSTPGELNQVRLDEVSSRLRYVACALSARSIDIKEAESVGGLIGHSLFLPRAMSLGPDRELNLRAYLYRVAYSISLSDSGVRLPGHWIENPAAQLLLSLIAVPIARERMKALYPGLAKVERRLLLLEIEARRSEQGGPTRNFWAELALEILNQALSDGEHDDREHSEGGIAREIVASIPHEAVNLVRVAERWLPLISREAGAKSASASMIPVIWGLVMPEPKAPGLLDGSAKEPPRARPDSLPSGTERRGKPKERIQEVKLAENREGENPLVHSFEKVRTLDDYVGGRKALDGSDELEEQLEALEELDLRKVVRSQERTDSIYKSDVMLDSGALDLGNLEEDGFAQYAYDEWDYSRRSYKKEWCKVFVDRRPKIVDQEEAIRYVQEVRRTHARQIRDLRKRFEEFTYVRRWRNRQPDGPEIDIDAVVDRYATIRSGHSPNPWVYLSRRPRERDFSTLVLLDSSLSTDSWLMNRRVIDVVKESMLVLGEVIEEYRDRLAIGAFFSNTRKDCRYIEVKRFEQSWAYCQANLVGLKPTGYTRIGPALRHGTRLLSQVPSRKKLLLLISDGKPTDYDRYEGRYGIEDIRQAIREAGAANITVRALAIDSQAKFYLPQMFGQGNFHILSQPSLLAESLAEIYGWLSV